MNNSPTPDVGLEAEQYAPASPVDLEGVKKDYESRLIVANLKTEAVRAGMVDLDGLKLIDMSAIQLDERDNIVNGQHLMTSLRVKKPWLFAAASSSSSATAPSSQTVRQKNALDMSDSEYRSARSAIIKQKY